MEYIKIGTAKGPGERPHQFLFITPDESGACKIGEFVFYVLEGVEGQRTVLGRIIGRAPVRLFPDSFMASPDVPPSDVAAALGYLDHSEELFEMTVAVMGHFDPVLRSFVNPRVLPRSGSPIYLAPADMLAEVLSKRKVGEAGAANVGWILSRGPGDVPVALDVNEFTSTHLSIIAGTGSGKSYLAGVTVEELMKPANKGCVLIVDPHGEYDTLLEIGNLPEFAEGSYRARVKIYRHDQVQVRFSSLTLDDMRYLLPTLTETMETLLTEAFNLPRPRSDVAGDLSWTCQELINAIKDVEQAHAAQNSDVSMSINGLLRRVERRFLHSSTFSDHEHLDLTTLLQPGQCTVLQLNEIGQRDQQVIVATLLRRMLRARMDTAKGQTQEGDERYLPYPVFVLIEEAHHFAPHAGDVLSTGILKQVLSEGRKFGVGVGLISQRPGKLDQDVLSQCMTHFVMRIVNPVDQASIASAVESVGRDLLDELPSLSKGQVVIAGSSLNTPVICQTRPRLTRHGGISMEATKEWEAYFGRQRDQQRDRSVIDISRRRSQIFQPEE